MPYLSLDIARELAENGFPQDSGAAALFYNDSGERVVRYPELPFPRMGRYRLPGLTTLIDACGDQFHSLMREDGYWYANDMVGGTAEEAVARLWLSQHEQTEARLTQGNPTRLERYARAD
jgi:hypothetical protein